MLKALIAAAMLSLGFASAAAAQNCPTYTYPLSDGSTAYGSQVMANFNIIMNCVNGLTANTRSTGTSYFGNNTYQLSIYANTASGGGMNIESGNPIFTTKYNINLVPYGGNIGVGTTSPSYKIDALTNSNSYDGMRVSNSNGGAQATTLFQFGNDTNSTAGDIGLNSSTNNNFGAPNTFWMVNGLNAPLVLGTSFSPRITILGNGNVGVGYSYPGYLFYVNGQAAGVDAWINASDARLKTNIQPITDALTLVKQLRGVRFQWRAPTDRVVGKDLKLAQGETHVGFIAQEVQAVLPEAVAAPKDSNGLYGLKEADLIPVLVQAIKEQQAEIDALKALVSASKSSN
jgi:hypothetical protein